MREILFRGKRIDGIGNRLEWVEGYFVDTKCYLDDSSEACIIPVDSIHYPHNEISEVILVSPFTVGQFTGMFDAGGRNIFEGDIMRTAVTGLKQNIGVVEFSDGAFGLRCISGDALFLCFVAGSFMVIGNIHDDPELMKKE